MFQRARTDDQINERKQDIIKATQELYKTLTFRQITFTKISEKTNIARSTIYNYYLNKEEIFLDILKEYYLSINEEINKKLLFEKLTKKEIIDVFTNIFLKYYDLLVINSLYIEQIEYVCSQERLNKFKLSVKPLFVNLNSMLRFQFSNIDEKLSHFFIQGFFSITFGIAPACSPIQKQKIAMQKAGTYYEFDKKEFIKFSLSLLFSCIPN